MSKAESTSALETFSSAVCDLVARAASSLVAIHSHRSRSSGFIWRPGLIVTADEALADEGEISVTLPGGKSLPATLAGRDPSTDIALLRVDRANLQPAWLGPVTPRPVRSPSSSEARTVPRPLPLEWCPRWRRMAEPAGRRDR